MEKVYLSHAQIEQKATRVAAEIMLRVKRRPILIYGVPRGGIPAAYMVKAVSSASVELVNAPEEADVVVDDIIGTGATQKRYEVPGRPFFALFEQEPNKWFVFPWEKGEADQSADDIFIRLLQYIGEDPMREGLRETPQRMAKAWKEWTAGYGQDPTKVLKVFEDGGEDYDQMLVEKDLPFYSQCEHHLAPFFGTATIAYIPDKKIVGLSKLGRVLRIFAQRLQVQERLTTQIADCLFRELAPKGVGVVVKARHLCKESRGLAVQGSMTVTSALRGVFLDAAVRAEFFALTR